MATYKIRPLVVGLNETDQGIMTYQRHYGERIHLPIYVFALEGGPKKILIDTGLEDFMVPDGAEEKYGFEVLHFEEALASIGWKPEDVEVIIHTHLHNDHCENDYKCTNAKVYVQKAEVAAMKDPHPLDHRYYDDVLDDSEVIEIEGDTELFEGISVMLTPGHSPGGQSVLIDTEVGKALITGFCSNAKNFPKGQPAIVPGVHLDAVQAYDSLQKVVAVGADILIPLHDIEAGSKGVIG
jgi:N-acyl homoserine lactone hydrolase